MRLRAVCRWLGHRWGDWTLHTPASRARRGVYDDVSEGFRECRRCDAHQDGRLVTGGTWIGI